MTRNDADRHAGPRQGTIQMNSPDASLPRRQFLTQAAAGGAVASCWSGAGAAAADAPQTVATAAPAAGTLVTTPAVAMAPRSDGIHLVWGVSRLARGRVELKIQDRTTVIGGTEFGFSVQGDRALNVRLDRLEPGTLYAYRTITEAMNGPAAREESPWREFRTLDPRAPRTQFAVWNDTHLNQATLLKLQEVTPAQTDFLVWNGDICNDWHQESALVPTLLHPAGADFTARRPLAFVWGNHDLRGPYGYQLPNIAVAPHGRSYYAFRSGPVAVVCLNTGEDKADDHPSFQGRVACEPLRREQAEWLRDVVLNVPELRDAPYRVVFCHIPLRWKIEDEPGRTYDSYSRRSRDLWHAALVAWRAQVIVSGHMHEAHYLEGSAAFPYAQLVGGGPQPATATVLEGDADPQRLQLTLKSLDGKTLARPTFPPLA